MGLSETIVAAMIGAMATIITATFQLLHLRGRAKAETRPKRGAARSLVTLGVIVLASGVGGFAYSELRAERVREDTRQLRLELSTQLRELATSTERLAHLRSEQTETASAAAQPVALTGSASSEAILRLAPLPRRADQCRRRGARLRRGYSGACGAMCGRAAAGESLRCRALRQGGRRSAGLGGEQARVQPRGRGNPICRCAVRSDAGGRASLGLRQPRPLEQRSRPCREAPRPLQPRSGSAWTSGHRGALTVKRSPG